MLVSVRLLRRFAPRNDGFVGIQNNVLVSSVGTRHAVSASSLSVTTCRDPTITSLRAEYRAVKRGMKAKQSLCIKDIRRELQMNLIFDLLKLLTIQS